MPTCTRRCLLFTGLLSLFATVAVAAQDDISVTVKKQARPSGSIAYQYTVVNNSKQTIAAVWIGHGKDDMELDVPPRGWKGLGAPIPAGSSSSPAHWKPMVITQEESDKVSIRWENDGQANIKPGQTLTGFSVVPAKASDKYLSSHWEMSTTNGMPVTGVLKTVE